MQDFYAVLNHVLGPALAAAKYELEDMPMHHTRGLFRYRKQLAEGQYGFIEFQNLYHSQSGLSRFRIILLKNSQLDARAPGTLEKTLSELIWNEFGARVLSAEDHWWLYKHPQDLAYEMYEAGSLLFAYGIPWLEGTLGDS